MVVYKTTPPIFIRLTLKLMNTFIINWLNKKLTRTSLIVHPQANYDSNIKHSFLPQYFPKLILKIMRKFLYDGSWLNTFENIIYRSSRTLYILVMIYITMPQWFILHHLMATILLPIILCTLF